MMRKNYKDMTAEECAKHCIWSRRKLFLVYILVLIALCTIHISATAYIIPLMFYDEECLRIYEGISRIQNLIVIISFLLCVTIAIIALLAQHGSFVGIYLNLCDPEKYINAEKIVCQKRYFGRRSRRQKCHIAGAYAALGDFDGAWKFYEQLVPKNLDKCNDIYILSGLSSYYHNVKDNEESARYLARLETIKASGQKRGSKLDMAIDHIKSVIAIDEKRYDEAKVLIDKYIDRLSITRSAKAVNSYNLGLIAYETGDYIEAIYRFKTTVIIGGKLFLLKMQRRNLLSLRQSLLHDN